MEGYYYNLHLTRTTYDQIFKKAYVKGNVDRALDKFSECQDNMSFHVQKWLDISNGWLDIPSKKEANKKE